MKVTLYNTLTRATDELKPQTDVVTFYSCGPTVYDYPHIGNWYAFIRWDIVSRVLKANGYTVNWVMNITDVGHLVSDSDEGEDKLEKGAKREGKTAWDVAKYYGDYFIEALTRLNFTEIATLPKATDHIPEQISLVKTLEEKGFTYTIDDGVYFNTAKLSDYGKLAHLDIEKLKAGARVELNPQKINVTDFALWKFSPSSEKRDMEWDSPWGRGFPGWHIECSAMSMKYLGETLDIHAGGIDHIPVHHTNEIAQSEAATGKQFANIWMHSNFILVNGKKMSKSLGNFYTLEDILERGYSLDHFRFAVISSHYRTEAQFSWDILSSAKERLQSLMSVADLKWQPSDDGLTTKDECEAYRHQLIQAVSNDINTPELLKTIGIILDDVAKKGIPAVTTDAYNELLRLIQDLTGIHFADRQDITQDQKNLLEERKTARLEKNWELSDSIRDTLASHGVFINDTASGQNWYK